MPLLVAILEDNAGRVAAMRACLADVLPGTEIFVFENAHEMATWLPDHLGDVILISLDHDLPLRDANGHPLDCGTGRQVADFLASLPPTCPVIVHSSNEFCAPGMVFALRDAGWPCNRVYPRDDLEWVRRDWGAKVEQYVRSGWIGASARRRARG